MQFSDIRASARTKADEPSTNFPSDTEVNRFINQGYRLVYGKIVQHFENFFIIPGSTGNGGMFNTVLLQQLYPLPPTMLKLIRTEMRSASSSSDDDWRRVNPVNIATDRGLSFYPIREGYTPDFGYFIAGNQMGIKPVPKTVYSMRLWFIPRVTDLVDDTDIPLVPEEYHELIAEFAAIQIIAKSGEPLYQERQQVFGVELQNMLETLGYRDQQSEQMTITEYDERDRYGV